MDTEANTEEVVTKANITSAQEPNMVNNDYLELCR